MRVKKGLSLILAVMILFSSVSFQIFAEDNIAMEDLTEYIIEVDFNVESEAMGLLFGGNSNSRFIMWQINTEQGKLNPHLWNNGWSQPYATTESDLLKDGVDLSMKIKVEGGYITTHVNGTQIGGSILIGQEKLGRLGFRASETESASIDRLKVSDIKGNVVFDDDFSDPSVKNFQGGEVKDGKLLVNRVNGTFFQSPPSDEKTPMADLTEYIIDVDFNVESEAMSLLFGGDSSSKFIMWQLNMNDGILKPHIWDNGWHFPYPNAASDLLKTGVNLSMKVKVEGGYLTTYINDTQLGNPIYVNEEKLGRLGFRASNTESSSIDRIKVTDIKGNVVFDDDFSDPSVKNFQGGEIKDGKLLVNRINGNFFQVPPPPPDIPDIPVPPNVGYSTSFTIDFDTQVIRDAISFVFGATDSNNYLMWQLNSASVSKGMFKSYSVVNNESSLLEEAKLETALGNDLLNNTPVHMTIEVNEGEINTYLRKALDSDDQRQLISTVETEPFSLGKIGLRAVQEGTENQAGLIDNIKIISKPNDKIVFVEDFSELSNNPFPGTRITDDRQLHVEGGLFLQSRYGGSAFQQELENKYLDPDRVFSTDVRWWLGTSSGTTDTLREEIQALYDGGFRGVELCMQNPDGGAPNEIYAYGSDQWSYKWKFMINELLDLGMGVYLTSGTNWATSNIPGLNPDSQYAMQNVSMGSTSVNAGSTLTTLPVPSGRKSVAKFIGAYAYKLTATNVVDYSSMVELTPMVEQGEDVWTQNLNWTAPTDGTYQIFALWTQGTYQTNEPSMITSYATNYFDIKGVEALKEFWEENYLNDPVLNQKILDGDVQLFMDSIELNIGDGITFWAEDLAEEFETRNGYDIRPYLFLIHGVDHHNMELVRNPYYQTKGTYDFDANSILREKHLNDYFGFLTDIYMERMLTPLKDWLNSVGIKTRAQISYGKPLEISDPIMAVDYPEAESFNQYHQVDIYRLWSGGAKLQNKVLSQEGATQISLHGATSQMLLKDAYSHYAAGFQRQIWHIWGSVYSYDQIPQWAGDTSGGGTTFNRMSWREPTFNDYDEFNAHLGRVQQLMQTGKSRTDIGFIHNNWAQGIRFDGGTGNDIKGMNWQFAHQGIYYRSTELQDNGYTYDYFSPKFLFADGVSFNEQTKTIEQAGYKAIVIYQRWLDIAGAEKILELAEKGLKVVIVDGSAKNTTFADGRDGELEDIIAKLKKLPTVRTAKVNSTNPNFDYFEAVADGYDDEVYAKLQELGVRPYAEFEEPNHQLLTQSRIDESGNMYLYAYNYCPNDYHHNSYKESVRNENHGTNIQTKIKMDGMFIPYIIDAWSGEVTEVGSYKYENGQTVFDIDLDYGSIALYAFEKVENEKLHVVSTDADLAQVGPNGLVVRATKSGTYETTMSNGDTYSSTVEVPKAYDIKVWDITVNSWNSNSTLGDLKRSETLLGTTTNNYRTSTVVTPIEFRIEKLDTWNNIPLVGGDVSGTGHYEADFYWDVGTADGAYLDLGTLNESLEVWINGVKVGGDITTNPTKIKRSVSGTIDGQPVDGKELNTGGISWTTPIADISAYLVNGKNEIVIEYSSSLTNRQLQRGYIGQIINGWGWWGNNRVYRDYGPSQAKIIPFVDSKYSPF